jgi:hypothetical protein
MTEIQRLYTNGIHVNSWLNILLFGDDHQILLACTEEICSEPFVNDMI